MTTAPVFFVDQLPNESFAVLEGEEGRHAATVRRLRPGEQLTLSDGRGGMANCEIKSAERDVVHLIVLQSWVQPAPRPRVLVAQALIKGDRGELAVELATEAGADAIFPWRAARCVARWDNGPRGDKAVARWRSTARAAAKQARRAWLPEISAPVSTRQLAEMAAQAELTLVLHESAQQRLADINLPTDGDLLLIVGPEGGITSEELAALAKPNVQTIRLGPEVLRASTAAAVALGALGPLTSRWS